MVEVALAWVLSRPGVSSLLLGASRPAQITANFAALSVELSAEHLTRLDAASALPVINPYFIFQLPMPMLFGGMDVQAWRRN